MEAPFTAPTYRCLSRSSQRFVVESLTENIPRSAPRCGQQRECAGAAGCCGVAMWRVRGPPTTSAATPTGVAATSPARAHANARKAAHSSLVRPGQSASCTASWREGRRSPCSSFLIVSVAQKTYCTSASWVRSRARLCRRNRRPNGSSPPWHTRPMFVVLVACHKYIA
jgi:hypothetical protein